MGGQPLLVTGLPRSGTSWVGKMLEASGEVVYINEPLNPQHPPGHSPGVLDATVEHRYHYICADNEAPWLRAFADTFRLRYKPVAEVRRNRAAYDLARMGKYATSFTVGRLKGRRAMLDDPWATVSIPWFANRMDCQAVVMVRRPESFAGSWRKLGWRVEFADLLAQPLLLRDVLGSYEAEMRSLLDSDDWVAQISLLWRAMYAAVADLHDTVPGLILVRYEDLAARPVAGFRALYDQLGLTWSDRVERLLVKNTTAADSSRVFGWNLRGGLSRTGFRPMDSQQSLTSYRKQLSEDEVDRICGLTADVATRIYGPGAG
ncbi:MAG: sulfotransferase [Mycobacteriales bacterium]